MLLSQARLKAKELDLDLVEVSPNSNPIVCKIMDYGKHLYQTQKKTKKAAQTVMKELRLKPRIGPHDLDVKMRSAKNFLESGHRVQFTMIFKGREQAHRDLGLDVLKKVQSELEEFALVEKAPFRDGRNFKMMLSPNSKK